MSKINLTETEKTIIKREYLRRKSRESYADYVEYVNEGRWLRARLHLYLCETVQSFIEKKTDEPYDILILNVPPQHGKSMTITEALPSWYLGKKPTHRVIEISYNDDFAQRFGRRNRDKIMRFGSGIFGITIAKSPNTNNEFDLSNGVGGMISRGVDAGVTGQPCNLMIIDDPIKNQAIADSPTYRRRLFDEWLSSYRTRLAPGAKVIVIQTRWHEDDLAGQMMKSEKCEVVNLPCEAEEGDLLGREPGEALAPEIGRGARWLKKFKAGYAGGMRSWNALYQGRPSAVQGNIIKREWWKYYTGEISAALTIISVDAAFKGSDDSDYVAIQVWEKLGNNFYLLNAVKKRLDFSGTVREILRVKKAYPKINAIIIEDKANGTAIIDVLRAQMPGVVGIEPKGGKIARASAASVYIESGNVFLPSEQMFTEDFVDECTAFPYAKNDDQVDAMSQAIGYLGGKHVGKGEMGTDDVFTALFKMSGGKSRKDDIREYDE